MENLIFHQANQQIASLLLLASSLVTILLLRGESVSGFKDLGKLFLFCNVLESLVRGSFVFFSNSATLNTVQAVHGVLEKGGEVSYVDFYANVWELVQRDQNVFKLAFRVANIAIAMYLVFVSFEGMVKENTAANYFKKQAEKKKRKKETAESDSDDEFEEKKTPNQNPTAITPQPPGGGTLLLFSNANFSHVVSCFCFFLYVKVLEEKKDYPSNFNAFFVALLVAHLSMIGLGLQETYGKVIMASKMDLGTFAATVQTSVPGEKAPRGMNDAILMQTQKTRTIRNIGQLAERNLSLLRANHARKWQVEQVSHFGHSLRRMRVRFVRVLLGEAVRVQAAHHAPPLLLRQLHPRRCVCVWVVQEPLRQEPPARGDLGLGWVERGLVCCGLFLSHEYWLRGQDQVA